MSRILEITHAQLVASNIYHGSYGKLIESLLHLEDFKVPVVEGFFFANVVKTPVSLSPTNSSCNCFFGFMKCFPYLKATQTPLLSLLCYVLCSGCPGSIKRLPFFMKIKRPSQLLVDRVVCLLFFIICFASNGNSEQFPFDCIL